MLLTRIRQSLLLEEKVPSVSEADEVVCEAEFDALDTSSVKNQSFLPAPPQGEAI